MREKERERIEGILYASYMYNLHKVLIQNSPEDLATPCHPFLKKQKAKVTKPSQA